MAEEHPSDNKPGIGSVLWRNFLALAIAGGIALLLLFLYLAEDVHNVTILSNLERKLVDQRFLIRGPRPIGDDIAIVAIDGKSIEEIGRFPWSRTTHAALVDKLREFGASAVAFDILFSEREGASEARRIQQIKATLPADDAELQPTRDAIDGALKDILVDKIFAASLERTFDDDKALVVITYYLAFEEDVRHAGQLGSVLPESDEMMLLDVASYGSRDDNVALMRHSPTKLALAIRPVLAELAEYTAMMGYANPILDKDANVRRERLAVVYSPEARAVFGEDNDFAAARAVLLENDSRVQAFMPLAVAAVATHLRLTVDQLVLDLPSSELRIGDDETPGGARVMRLDPVDGSARIDFAGAAATFPTYSFVDVLNDQLTAADGMRISGAEAFADKLVFVGATEAGLGDDFPTAFDARLPGVEKHANVAENILAGRQVTTHADETLVLIYIVIGICLLVALLAANLSPVYAGGIVLASAAGYYYATAQDFANNGQIWPWAVPGLTMLLGYAGVTAQRQLAERRARRAFEQRSEFVQNTFGRYLSDDVVSMILDSPEGLKLGGEKKTLTILMSDLRGFTALCERNSPEVVIGMLNHYLGEMADMVLKYGGTVDEFIGDAVLALFGAPMESESDAERAVACAIEMQMAMESVNRHCREQGLPEVEMGIALNTGDVIVGNIGSERRSKYGVVGSNVNLTARIESYTVGGQVLISGATLEQAGDMVDVGQKIDVKAKGLKEPVPAYVVKGIGGDYNLKVPEVVEELFDLPEPIAVKYNHLEGKHVGALMTKGKLTTLSSLGGDLMAKEQIKPLTNLKLKVLDREGQPLDGDLYAKVIDREAGDGASPVRFTSLPPAIKKFLKKELATAVDAAAGKGKTAEASAVGEEVTVGESKSDGASNLFKTEAEG